VRGRAGGRAVTGVRKSYAVRERVGYALYFIQHVIEINTHSVIAARSTLAGWQGVGTWINKAAYRAPLVVAGPEREPCEGVCEPAARRPNATTAHRQRRTGFVTRHRHRLPLVA